MLNKLGIRGVVVVAALISGAAFAQGSVVPGEEGKKQVKGEIPPEAKTAAETLTRYLDSVKAKKWAEVKKLTHPKTLEAIAQRKKRLGDEDHPMAPWFYEKGQYYMKAYKLNGAKPGPFDTWIIETTEDNFQVQEKGIAEGDNAAYLVGMTGGKWVVVDKKRGVTFTGDSIKYGYKGYFDAEATAAKEKEKAPEEGAETTP